MSGKFAMLRSAAVLEVSDVLASRAFYTERLGFTSGNLWGEPPCFCIVGHGPVTLFLDQSRETRDVPLNQYWAAYIYVEDVDAARRRFEANGVEIHRGPEDMPHCCREIDIRDPDGHIVCFGQDLSPGPGGPGL